MKNLKIDGSIPNAKKLRYIGAEQASKFLSDEKMKKMQYVQDFIKKLTERQEKGQLSTIIAIKVPDLDFFME